MKFCEKCKVNVAGKREYCPLCQGKLTSGEGSEEEEVFPKVKEDKSRLQLFLKILGLASVATAVISVTVNIAVQTTVKWSLFVIAGIFCGWVSFGIVLKKRKNILKNLMYQTTIASVLVVLWDYYTGWHGWAINYVIPLLFIASMLTMILLSKIMKIKAEEHLVYLNVTAIFGIIPIVFLIKNWVSVKIPSAICVCLSAVSLAGLLIFEGEKMRQEWNKRFHI